MTVMRLLFSFFYNSHTNLWHSKYTVKATVAIYFVGND
jgi:hypothetical protein